MRFNGLPPFTHISRYSRTAGIWGCPEAVGQSLPIGSPLPRVTVCSSIRPDNGITVSPYLILPSFCRLIDRTALLIYFWLKRTAQNRLVRLCLCPGPYFIKFRSLWISGQDDIISIFSFIALHYKIIPGTVCIHGIIIGQTA